jgi:hypothetical protein
MLSNIRGMARILAGTVTHLHCCYGGPGKQDDAPAWLRPPIFHTGSTALINTRLSPSGGIQRGGTDPSPCLPDAGRHAPPASRSGRTSCFASSMPSQRSPTSASRSGAVSIVKSDGEMVRSSSQRSGIETAAVGSIRGE